MSYLQRFTPRCAGADVRATVLGWRLRGVWAEVFVLSAPLGQKGRYSAEELTVLTRASLCQVLCKTVREATASAIAG